MRTAAFGFGLALVVSGLALGQAAALPAHTGSLALAGRGAATPVQLRCDQNRCIDPRTGVYGQSTCNARGCFPLGGPVGRVSPPDAAERAYGRQARGRDWDEDEWDEPRPRRRVYRYEVEPPRRYHRYEEPAPVLRYYRQPF